MPLASAAEPPSGPGLDLRDLRSPLRGPFTASFAAGACAVISGPSGIGKSLFLRMIADLDPNTGRVALDGQERAAMPAPRWRRLVTYVAAESGWWADRVVDNMADREAARSAFPAFGLDVGLLDTAAARLSTGERQRAALVRAIIQRPRFLLLDEPTASLDPVAVAAAEAELLRLKRGGTGLILVSHSAEQTDRLADRHLVMSLAGLEEVA